jgi:hypothetical protein
MDKDFDGNWEHEAQALIKQARDKARGINKFTSLEDLALEEGRKLTQMLLQGFTNDKGNGKDIPLPEEIKNSKPKNKGVKKKL